MIKKRFQQPEHQLFLSTAQNLSTNTQLQPKIGKLDMPNSISNAQKFGRNTISEAQFANFLVYGQCPPPRIF